MTSSFDRPLPLKLNHLLWPATARSLAMPTVVALTLTRFITLKSMLL